MTHGSPAFVELEPFPPESLLVRCAKGSSHLEGRMMVSNPKNWKWTSGGGSGGFEVRRKDWTKLREKMRRYTSFQWECKTIYVVCFGSLSQVRFLTFHVGKSTPLCTHHGQCLLFRKETSPKRS